MESNEEMSNMNENLKSLCGYFLCFRLKLLSSMNSEFEQPKKNSAPNYAF